jgi:hypothetical protein
LEANQLLVVEQHLVLLLTVVLRLSQKQVIGTYFVLPFLFIDRRFFLKGFGAFAASSNVPTFGVLANSGPSFETLASSGNAQPAFVGAAFPSSNPPSFGG